MTPEQTQQLQELYEWMQARKKQQISFPLDDSSKAALGTFIDMGAGASALTQVYTDSGGDTHTGPKAYAGTHVVNIGGKDFEIPYL